ncbi:GIY-YIG nuclease family protein [Salinimicrobium flavum]|uniref:GIY-YIG nuclease family protein n=1 Tax=Salinimicrobium flavum TaxID=1737065 RepID=A0ABW5IWK2_9FLAO
MYYVYVIYSSNFDEYYIGMTDALNRRLEEHNNGKNRSTKAYRPWEMVYNESLDSRELARKREKYLKSAAGRRWRKKFIRPRGATE